MSKQKIIGTLTAYSRTNNNEQYVVYMYDNPIVFYGVKAFKTRGIAKRAILNRVYGKNTKESSSLIHVVHLDDLIKEGIIEIRKL